MNKKYPNLKEGWNKGRRKVGIEEATDNLLEDLEEATIQTAEQENASKNHPQAPRPMEDQ